MARNSYKHKLMEKIFGLGNICMSTIAFAMIFVSLILFSMDIISVTTEAYFVLFMMLIFVSDQLLLKPLFGRIEESIN
jgi:hypothetical protein